MGPLVPPLPDEEIQEPKEGCQVLHRQNKENRRCGSTVGAPESSCVQSWLHFYKTLRSLLDLCLYDFPTMIDCTLNCEPR